LPVGTPTDREYAAVVHQLVSAVERSAATGAFQKQALRAALTGVESRQPDPDFAGREAVAAALFAYHWQGCKAAQTAVCVLQRLAVVRTLRFVRLPRLDFDRVLVAARQQKWTDDTPVPPEVFGPMWDRDPPLWWREDVLGADASEMKNPE